MGIGRLRKTPGEEKRKQNESEASHWEGGKWKNENGCEKVAAHTRRFVTQAPQKQGRRRPAANAFLYHLRRIVVQV